MYNLYWINNLNQELKYHGVFKTEDEALVSIFDWWEENDFKPKYVRKFTFDDILNIDYGSHYFFYLITKKNLKEKDVF